MLDGPPGQSSVEFVAGELLQVIHPHLYALYTARGWDDLHLNCLFDQITALFPQIATLMDRISRLPDRIKIYNQFIHPPVYNRRPDIPAIFPNR